MVELIAVGIGYGLLLSVMVGPAFFVLIETSIMKGTKAGLFLDLGVLLSDLMYIIVAFLFYQEVTELMSGSNRFILKVIGGGFFMVFGIMHLLKKSPKLSKKLIKSEDLSASTLIMAVVKGFTINLLNPGVLFYWLTLMTLLPDPSPELGLNHTQALIIYIGLILLTFFSLDVLKVLGAKKLKEILTPQWMRLINVVLGIILILFGTIFLIQGIIALMK